MTRSSRRQRRHPWIVVARLALQGLSIARYPRHCSVNAPACQQSDGSGRGERPVDLARRTRRLGQMHSADVVAALCRSAHQSRRKSLPRLNPFAYILLFLPIGIIGGYFLLLRLLFLICVVLFLTYPVSQMASAELLHVCSFSLKTSFASRFESDTTSPLGHCWVVRYDLLRRVLRSSPNWLSFWCLGLDTGRSSLWFQSRRNRFDYSTLSSSQHCQRSTISGCVCRALWRTVGVAERCRCRSVTVAELLAKP